MAMPDENQTIAVCVVSIIGFVASIFYIAIGVLFSHLVFGPLNYVDPVDLALIVLWPLVMLFWIVLIIGGIVGIWIAGEIIWERARDAYRQKKRGLKNDG